MNSLTLPPIPAQLTWENQPLQAVVENENQLRLIAGAKTDWFIDPDGRNTKSNAPLALFTPPDKSFLLAAQVRVDFGSPFDAGVLFVFERDDLWAKLCFEYSPQYQPSIVSVVTRGVSDDCNSVPIEGHTVHLRIYRQPDVFAFHYSTDGRYWQLVRYFTIGKPANLRIGFSVQSPTGPGCTALFSEINYRPGNLSDLRNGE